VVVVFEIGIDKTDKIMKLLLMISMTENDDTEITILIDYEHLQFRPRGYSLVETRDRTTNIIMQVDMTLRIRINSTLLVN